MKKRALLRGAVPEQGERGHTDLQSVQRKGEPFAGHFHIALFERPEREKTPLRLDAVPGGTQIRAARSQTERL